MQVQHWSLVNPKCVSYATQLIKAIQLHWNICMYINFNKHKYVVFEKCLLAIIYRILFLLVW